MDIQHQHQHQKDQDYIQDIIEQLEINQNKVKKSCTFYFGFMALMHKPVYESAGVSFIENWNEMAKSYALLTAQENNFELKVSGMIDPILMGSSPETPNLHILLDKLDPIEIELTPGWQRRLTHEYIVMLATYNQFISDFNFLLLTFLEKSEHPIDDSMMYTILPTHKMTAIVPDRTYKSSYKLLTNYKQYTE